MVALGQLSRQSVDCPSNVSICMAWRLFSLESYCCCTIAQQTGTWKNCKADDVPTLTAVLPSSSDARLPPCRLLILRRLLLRGVRISALMGRGAGPVGDAGGETVILPRRNHAGWEQGGCRKKTSEKSGFLFGDVKESRSSGRIEIGDCLRCGELRGSVSRTRGEPLKFFGG